MINLSIIIPIYKESENIQRLAKDIINNISIKNYEILFIDDNSNDSTEEILKKLSEANRKIKYIVRKEEKKDLSKSCILGFENSLFDNILVMDGDLQHDPSNINKLIEAYVGENADIVVGSRNLFKKKNEGLGLIRLTSSKFLILFVSLFLNKKTDDPMSGFFIFRKKIYESNKNRLFAKGYKILFDLIYVSNEKLKIIDVDINFRKRSEGSSKMGIKIIFILILVIAKKIFIRK